MQKNILEKKERFIFWGTTIGIGGDLDRAIEEYNKVLDLDPNHGDTHNMLGDSYVKKRNFSKAVEHLKKYVSLSPGEANPLDSLAEGYFWMGRLDEALASYKQALELKPDFESALSGSGYISLLNEKYDEAMEWFDKFVAVTPPGVRREGYLWKGFCRYWSGSLEDCNFYLREAANLSEPGYHWGLPLINWQYHSNDFNDFI